MRYEADSHFGCWLLYFDRLLEIGSLEANKAAVTSAIRKWPDEHNRMDWALRVKGLEAKTDGLRKYYETVSPIIDRLTQTQKAPDEHGGLK